MAPLQRKLNALRDKEASAKAVSLLGKHYKYRNCYSCPQTDADYWWLYVKVTGIRGTSAAAFSFQTDKDGKLEIETNEWFSGSSGYTEITAKEFNSAWRTVQKRIAGTKP